MCRNGGGAHKSAAFARSVAWVYIEVARIKAIGAMIARAVAEGRHLSAAVAAYKAAVVFGKGFFLHKKLSLNKNILQKGVLFLL